MLALLTLLPPCVHFPVEGLPSDAEEETRGAPPLLLLQSCFIAPPAPPPAAAAVAYECIFICASLSNFWLVMSWNYSATHIHNTDINLMLMLLCVSKFLKILTRTSGDVCLQVAFALLLRWYADKCSSGHVDGKDRTKK